MMSDLWYCDEATLKLCPCHVTATHFQWFQAFSAFQPWVAMSTTHSLILVLTIYQLYQCVHRIVMCYVLYCIEIEAKKNIHLIFCVKVLANILKYDFPNGPVVFLVGWPSINIGLNILCEFLMTCAYVCLLSLSISFKGSSTSLESGSTSDDPLWGKFISEL